MSTPTLITAPPARSTTPRSLWINSASCDLCQRVFTLFRRRHHCRGCDKCVCNDCSSSKVIYSCDLRQKVVFFKSVFVETTAPLRTCDECLANQAEAAEAERLRNYLDNIHGSQTFVERENLLEKEKKAKIQAEKEAAEEITRQQQRRLMTDKLDNERHHRVQQQQQQQLT